MARKKQPETLTYWCNRCGKLIEREAENGTFRQWRKSFCLATGRNARIYLKKTEKDLRGDDAVAEWSP
jgi:hypothetical protein